MRRYKEYAKDFSKFIPNIKENIMNSDTGMIRIKEKDLIKSLGKDYQNIKFITLYVALKIVLFREGIFLSAENTRRPYKRCYIMRFGNEDDILSPWLSERLDKII